MASSVPVGPAEITLPWINGMLASAGLGPAASITVEPFAVGVGAYSEHSRIYLSYRNGAAGPHDLIAKFPRSSPTLRAEVAKTRAYELEDAFYRELAAETPILTPTCYFTHHNPQTQDALLVYEYVQGVSGNQVDGATRTQAELAVREAARLHSHWDGSGVLGKYDWLRPLSDSSFLTTFDMGQDIIDQGREALRGLAPSWLLQRANDAGFIMAEQLRQLDREPRTLLHVDYRLDNMIFSDDGTQMTLIDWQQIYCGPGLWDVGYFISQSVNVSDRRKWEKSLVSTYLSGRGTGGSDAETWLEPLQRIALFSAFNCFRAGALLDLSVERTRQLLQRLTERSCAMVEDYDAVRLLTADA